MDQTKNMKITIDTSCLVINPYSGLSAVVQNLISEMPRVEYGNRFTLFYNYFRSENEIPINDIAGVNNQKLRVPRRFVNWSWKFDWSPVDLLFHESDIFHSLHIQVPPTKRLKKVLTVHDCRFLAFPELYSEQNVMKYRLLMNTSLERADVVVTDSNFTRQELLKYFEISEERVKVVHCGFRPYVPTLKYTEKTIKGFIERNNLPDEFLLFVGVLDPRKNLKNLLEALSLLKSDKSDFPDLVLLGVTQNDWYKSDLYKRADELGLLSHIHIAGVVDKDILFGIIQKALVLCYPSIYEGFGFPPLEAMSQGTPVLAGNKSSVPEVAGDAACLVNPFSVDQMAYGLQKVIYDNSYRQNCIRRGFERINKFSWSRAASQYLQIYEEVLS